MTDMTDIKSNGATVCVHNLAGTLRDEVKGRTVLDPDKNPYFGQIVLHFKKGRFTHAEKNEVLK